jgi:serine/threonine protein kinase
MATVYLARLNGPVGSARMVSVKHLHPHLVRDRESTSRVVDEARRAASVRHPNVVAVLDVVLEEPDVYLVTEYVPGETLDTLAALARKRKEGLPIAVSAAIMVDALAGLHAAHRALDDTGRPLDLIHGDVTPPSILVGVDGASRVLDLGLARAMGTVSDARPGVGKGKSPYLSPEQARGEPLNRQTDIFGASAVFWEMLTGRPLFSGASDPDGMKQLLENLAPGSGLSPHLPPALAAVLARGLATDPDRRYASAQDMAQAISSAVPSSSRSAVGEWVNWLAAESLADRAAVYRQSEAAFRNASSTRAPALPSARTPSLVVHEPSENRSRVSLGARVSAPVGTRLASRRPTWLRPVPLVAVATGLTLALVLAFRSPARPRPTVPNAPAISLQSLTATGLPTPAIEVAPTRSVPEREPAPEPAAEPVAEPAAEPASVAGSIGPIVRRRAIAPIKRARAGVRSPAPRAPSRPPHLALPLPPPPATAQKKTPPGRAPLVDDSGRAPVVE